MLPPPSRRKPPHLLLHKEYPRCHASRQPPRSWSPVRAFTHRRHIVPRILVNEFLASSSLNSQFVSLLNVSALVYLFLSTGDSSCSRPSSRRRSRCRTRLPQPSGSSFVDAGVLIGCACLHPQSPTTDCHIFPPSVRISPILFPWRVKSVEDPTSSSSNPRAKVRQADVC
uniref:Uncharacterized protein n=1 Tax=Cucumis sativus TaxID=3659 RepID=A0A0A0LCV9_CUCSA